MIATQRKCEYIRPHSGHYYTTSVPATTVDTQSY
ncbi:hypothetical protein LCGC14_2648310, partial [marine sediment metagenome]